MNSLKLWLIEVGIKKIGPSAIRGAILGISGWLLVRSSSLSSFGIVSDQAARTTVIQWDQLNASLIMIIPAIIAAIIKLVNHQANEVVLKSPGLAATTTEVISKE